MGEGYDMDEMSNRSPNKGGIGDHDMAATTLIDMDPGRTLEVIWSKSTVV